MPSSVTGSSRRKAGATGSALLAAALSLAFAPAAHALYNDRVEVFAGESLTYDSNVFRLPDAVDTTAITGSGSRSDWWSTTTVGVTADLPYSQQRFQLEANGFAARYQDFKDLDYNGYNARANWMWAVTSALTGELGASRSKTLSSFANIQLRERDLVTSSNAWANAKWMVTPSWRLHGGLTASKQEHSNGFRAAQDLERGSAEVGLSYVNAQENRIGVAVRTEHGERPDPILLERVSFDNAYDQVGVGILAHWIATGHSTFDARADYIKRDYDQFTGRNYKGPTFAATWTWTPTGKLTFVTTALRDIGPAEDINTSFVLVKGISVKPRWAITSKVDITGNLEYSTWDYRTDPLLAPSYEHKVRGAGLGVAWRPLRRVLLQAGWTHEKRTSTLLLGDYDVDLFVVEGRIGF